MAFPCKILDMLPAVLDEKQKANKVRNLLHAMSTRDKTIGKSTDLAADRWVLTPSKDGGI
jgi:ATP-dependent DNA helicase RecG